MTLKIAEFAPMPSARVRTATAVNAGRFIKLRAPYRMSLMIVSILCFLCLFVAASFCAFCGPIQPTHAVANVFNDCVQFQIALISGGKPPFLTCSFLSPEGDYSLFQAPEGDDSFFK